jgi:hypothetical protein
MAEADPMKRIARLTLNALTALSLLLCLAAAGLWVRSYWAGDTIRWRSSPRAAYGLQRVVQWELRSGRGGLRVTREYDLSKRRTYALLVSGRGEGWSLETRGRPAYPSERGFEFGSRREDDADHAVHEVVLTFPAWCIVLFAALLPWTWRERRRRHLAARRLARGQCPSCSYDLTGNTSGVCPECGNPRPSAD